MERELRILMLGDQEDDASLIENALKTNSMTFISSRVDSKEGLIQALTNFEPDVVLSDHMLSQLNSTEALGLCRAHAKSTPFLLVTGGVSEEFAVNCLKLGADDYILKSDLDKLPVAIRRAIREKQRETLRRRLEVTLRYQNKELKKLNRELDSMIYSTSHNLRAPLRSVMGLIELSRHELTGNNIEAISDLLIMMETSVNRLDGMLGLILEYFKASRIDDRTEEIDFLSLIDSVFSGLTHLNGVASIEKRVTVHPGNPVHCNRMRLNLVLLNLLSNAVKYFDPAKQNSFVSVDVFAHTSEVIVIIRDNGIGISNSAQSRVFDMFYRGTDKVDGTGLGLYIVKETLYRMRGKLNMESVEGAGTTFTLNIPNSSPDRAI